EAARMAIDSDPQHRNAGMLNEQGDMELIAGGRGTGNLERNRARVRGYGSRSIVRRLLRLERIPLAHRGGIVRRDTDSMIGQIGVKLLGGAVELPQVKDLGGLIRGACPRCGKRRRGKKQQAQQWKTIRP